MPRPDHPSIPPDAVEERHLAGTGPGGQNVNKVATAIQLRVDVSALDLAPSVYRRLKELAGSRMTADGALVLTARSHRTQEANRREALARVGALLDKARQRPAYRIKTKPSRSAKAKRVDKKKARSQIKQARGKPRLD
ncbi:alternative ribosome rescue aminoacyl-tRNA hydrolase ArfB [Parasphingopyxis marina]|uniref:Aminoacyl-tRNA hydrolase n=1 Tax=Parasphingopyxis marina TaxID=2761622 RepID=A0A842HV67_9SPHN|nr:alternative ribosome rescue aminoacyl-tRNA hydrolase ArfB [Parasphingopyxis marina]MBC2776862.1 aminoacyl-tRNA hydrolase [Parasphingopyxis marina]